MILQKLKTAAEDFLGEKVTKAVITVPAYFNDEPAAGHQASRAKSPASKCCASSMSRRLRRWPTAWTRKKDETIAVYDLGGGTFDISILEVGEGVVEVKATAGDTHLGGDDVDHRIVEWLIEEFKKDQGIDLGQGSHGAAAAQGSGGRRPRSSSRSSRRRKSICRS